MLTGMMRHVFALLCLLGLCSCARLALPDTPVRAEDEPAFAAFRAELGSRFAPAELAAFDTAIQELQLAGMDQGLVSAAERAAAMRRQVHGLTVRAAEILGWQTRRTRILGEIAQMSATLERDLQTRERQGAGTSLTVTNRIQNMQDILVRLRGDLAEAEQRLAAWGAAPAR